MFVQDRRHLISLWIRWILGFIFVYAGINKAMNPVEFAEIIQNYRILPDGLINIAAVLIPWVEIVTGFFLIFGIWLIGAVSLCNFLLLIFFCSLSFNMLRGLNIECGCFSVNNDSSAGNHMWWYLIRDSIFFILGGYLFVQTLFRDQMGDKI